MRRRNRKVRAGVRGFFREAGLFALEFAGLWLLVGAAFVAFTMALNSGYGDPLFQSLPWGR